MFDAVVGVGLGDLTFGLSRSAVEEALGLADKVDTDNEGFPLLQYNDLRSTFWFDQDNRLHWIQSKHSELTVLGRRTIGAVAEEMLEFLRLHLGEAPEIEDYGSFESHHFRGAELEVQVEYGAIDQVCFGHLWEGELPNYECSGGVVVCDSDA